jgi:hypothetical protein
MTRLLTRFTLAAVLVLARADSFGSLVVFRLPPLALAGLGFRGRVVDSLATRMGEAPALGFRMARLLTRFTLVAVLVFVRVDSFGFFVVFLLPPLALTALGFRRRVFGWLRVTRRTARAAGFTASPERGFFIFIPGCDPFGGYRILSDGPYITAAARDVQCETGAKKVGKSRHLCTLREGYSSRGR